MPKQSDRFEIRDQQMEFAKTMFNNWDESSTGELNLDQITHPLVNLGLATDKPFVEKLLAALDIKPDFRGQLTLTLNDFVKIFRHDKTGDKITQTIKKEVLLKHQDQIF